MIRRRSAHWIVCAAVAGYAVVDPPIASAQQPPAARPAPAPQQTSIRGFGDFGAARFAASDTFDAVLGSSSGVFFGGGAEVVFPARYFVNVRLSRFRKAGERVFVDGGDVFPLGIPVEVGITPVEVTGGYRFQARGRTRNIVPYVGAGLGWHRYSETSDFADSNEDVSETFTGYHVLGGVEVRLGRIFAIGGEGQWTTVPDALGSQTSSASEAFGETNLGGIGFRVRFTVGR